MLRKDRLEKVLQNLSARGLSQMIVSDPASIFYLTGRWIHPGERLLALYINTDSSKNHIFINELFTVPEDLGVPKVWFSDTDDYVGILAKLELSAKEKERAKKEMGQMLDYFDKLNELDTTGIEPVSHITRVQNVFREDVITNDDEHEKTLQNAPDKKNNMFMVPKTFD